MGASCAIGSARLPSARSMRSACRSSASFRSRRTWIPGSRWPTRRRYRGWSRSRWISRCGFSPDWPGTSRTSRSSWRSSGSRALAKGSRLCWERRLVAWSALDRFLARGPADLTSTAVCARTLTALQDTLRAVPGGLAQFLADGPIGHPALPAARAGAPADVRARAPVGRRDPGADRPRFGAFPDRRGETARDRRDPSLQERALSVRQTPRGAIAPPSARSARRSSVSSRRSHAT